MRQFRLRLAQCLLGVICADRRCNVCTGTSITEKISPCVKKRLAAFPHLYRGSSPVERVLEIAKWLMSVEYRPMLSPFFGIRFDIRSDVPAVKSQSRGLKSDSIDVLRYDEEPGVRGC